jgi:hypothetical protein
MKTNTSNNYLLVTGLYVALAIGAVVSAAAFWTLGSQEVVHANDCGGICQSSNDCPGSSSCYCSGGQCVINADVM